MKMQTREPGAPWRVGIDAGSKTIKVVVLDEDDEVVYAAYRRHRSNIRDTLRDVIHDVIWVNGDLRASVRVTGSAGISVSKLFGVPFVQEVVATTDAVKRLIPDADAIVELGGEDAKVVYLTGGVEQRMNATCAGGTGGFIDTIAFMLGVRASAMSNLAMGAQRIYPIASRCAVFAQTDIRPLLNEGASKADIAASALDAVVRQTLGGLACGRPLKGNVVFLGGPFQHIPELVHRFRRALDLDHRSGIKPPDAHLYPAIGAAMGGRSVQSARSDASAEGDAVRGLAHGDVLALSSLEALLSDGSAELDGEGVPRLAPLFASSAELEAFRERHAKAVFPTKRAFDAEGPLYLGVDSGSTTVKLALIDADGNLLHSDYRPSRGDVVETVREMLASLHRVLPSAMLPGHEPPYIAHATATGYGEGLLLSGFGVDSGVVETTAHVRAARHFCPEATFVLDIGGQDMKALWLNGAHVSDAVLNEACSSGCGAFLEGTAHGLHCSPTSFAAAALEATSPVDLGTRCTVFMSSRVKHAQKAGASVEDIAAGAAYSVIHNALYRIIGADRASSLGSHVVVQGGTFKSDAVLRAFEMTCGVEAIRPDRAHLMGAIGAALIARDRALRAGGACVSSLVTKEALDAMEPKRRVQRCGGCVNACRLNVLDMGEGRILVAGNRCERWRLPGGKGAGDADGEQRRASREEDAFRSSAGTETSALSWPNLIAREQELIASAARAVPRDGVQGARSSVRVGVIASLEPYRFAPFWAALVGALGFTVLLPDEGVASALRSKAWETVPAEGACYPAKLVHAKAFSLKEQGADALLFPRAQRNNHCAVASGYAHALRDSVEWLREDEVTLLDPLLTSAQPEAIASHAEDEAALASVFAPLCARAGLPLDAGELASAVACALEEQRRCERILAEETDEALRMLERDPHAHAVVVAGRPYHVDPAVMHGIDAMLHELGFIVLGMTGLASSLEPLPHRDEGLPEWRQAKRLMKAAQFVVRHPQVDLVCLQSFGCGFDAVSLEEARELFERHGRPFTALKLDEMVETAHIRIRLRTLAESIEGARAQRERGCGQGDDLRAGPSESASEPPVPPKRARLLVEPLGEEDLAKARACTVKDACFTANVLAARAIRLLEDDPALEAIELPYVCNECLVDAIPRMIERATGKTPQLIWEEGGGAVSSGSPVIASPSDASGPRPKIGIIGNPLLVFEPYMNDGIVSLLDELGCEAVLPEEGALYVEDVRYEDQLERFAKMGVEHVIYLQSFGCVKGHVQARGSHHAFTERFPDMPVTVLDYDPEASALNRENRIRLIAETVIAASKDPQ